MKLLVQIFYRIFKVVGAFFYILPFSFKKRVAYALSLFWFYVFPLRVRVILHNLILVFPRQSEESMERFRERSESLARKNMEHVVLCLFEIFERFHWTKKRVFQKRLKIFGVENVQPSIDQKIGFFFLTSHVGNWEALTQVGVFAKIPLVIITKFLRNPFFDQIWIESRKAYGLEMLKERGSGLAAVKAVKQGKALGFILDQHTGEPHGIESQFLGHKAWSPKGLAILSHRLKAPIFPAYLIREANGDLVAHIEPELSFPDLASKETLSFEDIQSHVFRCNKKIGEPIYKYPEQYLWMHKRFKNLIDYRQKLVWEL